MVSPSLSAAKKQLPLFRLLCALIIRAEFSIGNRYATSAASRSAPSELTKPAFDFDPFEIGLRFRSRGPGTAVSRIKAEDVATMQETRKCGDRLHLIALCARQGESINHQLQAQELTVCKSLWFSARASRIPSIPSL